MNEKDEMTERMKEKKLRYENDSKTFIVISGPKDFAIVPIHTSSTFPIYVFNFNATMAHKSRKLLK